MRYHLFQKFFGKMVKIKEMSFLAIFVKTGVAIRTDGRRPEVRIAPPISKNEVRIYRCARARLTAFTLLFVN